MNRDLALWRWAGVGLVWDATVADPARAQAAAEIAAPQPEPVHVHYHLHLPPGMTAEGLALALPQQRNAITTEVINEGTGEQE